MSADTYCLLLHDFEHGTLSLCTGTVDLIEEYEVRIDRTDLVFECVLLHVVDLCTDDITRDEVRRTLDSRELTVNCLSHDLSSCCLSKTRNRLQKDVSVRDHCYDKRKSEELLAYDLTFVISSETVDYLDGLL